MNGGVDPDRAQSVRRSIPRLRENSQLVALRPVIERLTGRIDWQSSLGGEIKAVGSGIDQLRIPEPSGRALTLNGFILCVLGILVSGLGTARGQLTNPTDGCTQHVQGVSVKMNGSAQQYSLPPGSLFRVAMASPLRWADWRPGTWKEAEFLRPVYSEGKIIIPAKSRLVMEIDQIVTARDKSHNHLSRSGDIASLVYSAFHNEQSHMVTLRTAVVISPSGSVIPVRISILNIAEWSPVRTKGEKKPLDPPTDIEIQLNTAAIPSRHTELILRLDQQALFPTSVSGEARPVNVPTGLIGIKAGTHARLMLLTPLSASANRNGDPFQARLMEPIFIDGEIGLPEGCLLEGRIIRRVPPRCLNRAGKLHLGFERLILPNGCAVAISGSLSGAENDGKAQLYLDSEGVLAAQKQGTAAVMLNIVTSWLVGKMLDDLLEEGIKWGAAVVTDASAAATARYFGMGIGVALFVMQRGKDAWLSKYANLEVTFNRPVKLDLPATRHESLVPPASSSEEFQVPIPSPTAESAQQ